MATVSLNLSLSESTRAHLEDAIEFGAHTSASSYIAELIEKDHAQQVRFIEAKLNETIGQEPIEVSEEEWMSGDVLSIMKEKLKKREQSLHR